VSAAGVEVLLDYKEPLWPIKARESLRSSIITLKMIETILKNPIMIYLAVQRIRHSRHQWMAHSPLPNEEVIEGVAVEGVRDVAAIGVRLVVLPLVEVRELFKIVAFRVTTGFPTL
jgi:hypothetical protein